MLALIFVSRRCCQTNANLSLIGRCSRAVILQESHSLLDVDHCVSNLVKEHSGLEKYHDQKHTLVDLSVL